ncbi:MAG: cytochrome PufQ [Pseudomonadota bacterium]
MGARSTYVPASKQKSGGLEYSLYFAAVFAISLVPATVQMIVPKTGQTRKFFVTDAWAKAQEVTPMIFHSF